jgi:molecular chaperone DnaK (HSP70)
MAQQQPLPIPQALSSLKVLFSSSRLTSCGITDRQIPTALSYVDGDEYYGTQAKAFLVRNPTNTIAYFRDFLGQEYDCHYSQNLISWSDDKT